MSYFTTVVKTNYTHDYLKSHQREIEKIIKTNTFFTSVQSSIMNLSNNNEIHFKIFIWTLNNQEIKQVHKEDLFLKIKSILGEQSIISIELN